MLQIVVPGQEFLLESTMTFVKVPNTTLQLEHSLVSLSKWESKWHKPFITRQGHTTAQFIDYVRCMTLTQNVNPLVYQCLTKENIQAIQNYMEDEMTATTISGNKRGGGYKVMTSQVIYYLMIANEIPFECQKWHLNRLLMLIRVCNEKNTPGKKMSRKDVLARNKALNESRRARAHSKG